MESTDAFKEALLRARQLAAKITHPSATSGTKRPNEDDADYPSDVKKIDLGSKLAAMKNPTKPSKDQLYLSGTIINGEKILDLMIPGNKVGFVIGKGGEMIRNLQERAGVKMAVYQETVEAGERDKQLRISGVPEKVDIAKQMVNDLLVEKELELVNRMNKNVNNINNNNNINNTLTNKVFTSLNEYGSARITYFEYPVSPQLIGLVIGKGGETIRKIQADSGCKVQFDTTKVDAQGNKICQFTGTQDTVNRALDMVKDIINTATGGQGSIDEIRLVVPTSRTGTVIGRGGETIRVLKQQSGCNIELDKNFHSDNDEKCFIIRGTADKIQYAQQLVTDKVGGHATVILNTLTNNPMYAAAAAATSTDGQYGYLTNQIYANQIGQSQYYWPQTSSDPKSVQDQYAMWAAYYAQYYSQANGVSSAAAAADPHQQQQAAWAAATAASSSSGQQDNEAVYQQWIEYYKACGMTKEAEAFEQKLKEYKNAKALNSKDNDNNSHSQHNGKSPK